MHGRIKVRTSEEERERKKKEQALKVKAYKHGMSKIQAKRQLAEYDDEMQLLTGQLLLRNPDLATLWNIRKQCVNSKADALANAEAEDKEKAATLYETELTLTEQCLQVNPKSYGSWHHRCWTLEHSPVADWQRELQLCTKYLKLDERNFHTWNYRRYVADKAGVPQQQELDFCTEKIKVNFSNYSSWHQRSLLLPALYPYEAATLPKRPMCETKLREELELVLTAAFTDPNDSSAWFYQRWLLGHARTEPVVCAFRCNRHHAVLAFTHPVDGPNLNVLLDIATNQIQLTDWKAAVAGANVHTTWHAKLSLPFEVIPGSSYQLKVQVSPQCASQELQLQMASADGSLYYLQPPNRGCAYSAELVAELQAQLESCNSLLEFEPDSKWTLLTAALLMRAIDWRQHHDKSLEYVAKLREVDSLRAGYYNDLASQWMLEKLLFDWSQSEDVPQRLNLKGVSELTAIHYPQYLCIADELVLSPELEERYGKENSRLVAFGRLKEGN